MSDSGPTLDTRLLALPTLAFAAGLAGVLPAAAHGPAPIVLGPGSATLGPASATYGAASATYAPPVGVFAARPAVPDTLVHIVLETELGEIEVALDSAAAPVTTANFLRYVEAGLYEGGTFYRTVRADNQPDDSLRIAVIQGGVDRSRRGQGFDPIPMEGTGTTGLRHLDGTISMARGGPDSARGEFFICVGDQPELDEGGRRNPDGRGFAAFGQVVRGMEVVHAIHRRAAEGQYLTEPVRIVEARQGG